MKKKRCPGGQEPGAWRLPTAAVIWSQPLTHSWRTTSPRSLLPQSSLSIPLQTSRHRPRLLQALPDTDVAQEKSPAITTKRPIEANDPNAEADEEWIFQDAERDGEAVHPKWQCIKYLDGDYGDDFGCSGSTGPTSLQLVSTKVYLNIQSTFTLNWNCKFNCPSSLKYLNFSTGAWDFLIVFVSVFAFCVFTDYFLQCIKFKIWGLK